MTNYKEFKKGLEEGGMHWLSAYWFRNFLEYHDKLEARVAELEQRAKG